MNTRKEARQDSNRILLKAVAYVLAAIALIFAVLAIAAGNVHAATLPVPSTQTEVDGVNDGLNRPANFTADCWGLYSKPADFWLFGQKTFGVRFFHKACAGGGGNITCCGPGNISAAASIYPLGDNLGYGYDGDYSNLAWVFSGIGADNEKWYAASGKPHAIHRTVKLVRFSACGAPTPIGCSHRDVFYVLATYTDHAWGWGPKSLPWSHSVWRSWTNPDFFARKPARAAVTHLPIQTEGDYR